MDQANVIKKIEPETAKPAQDVNINSATDAKDTVVKVQKPLETTQNKGQMLKKFPKSNMKSGAFMVVSVLLVVLVGIGTGWKMSGISKGSGGDTSPTGMEEVEKSENEAGIEDESAFPDSAEGILEEGGIEGEGTHHLVRDGGPTKYVYLTSTVIDLESFKGKTVMVWGETISAKQAGWLMDVGKIKVTK